MTELIKKTIENDEVIQGLKSILKDTEAYLVGGFIRDLYFKKKSCDRDIVLINADTKSISCEIAEKLNGTFIELDEENKIYRIVLNDKKNYIDVAQALDNSLHDDINRRDFTINSIFYSLNDCEFLDKNGGFEDLKNGLIRTCRIENITDDPLRMLRVFRFAANLGFEIDSQLKAFIRTENCLIQNIAKERIHQELVKLFEGKYAAQNLMEMHRCHILNKIFPFVDEIKKIPCNPHHHLDLLHHSVETVRKIRLDRPLLKLAGLLHDIGKPDTHTIEKETGRHRFIRHNEVGAKLAKHLLADLKFSKKEIDYVTKMIRYHIYPSALMQDENRSEKSMARFVRRLAPDVEDIIELARADRLSAVGPMITPDKIETNLNNLKELWEYFKKIEPTLKDLPKLISGVEVMEILDIKPSPFLGRILDELKEAQIAGLVTNKKQAIAFVKEYGHR